MTEQIYKDIETIKAQLIEDDTPEYNTLIGNLLTEVWLLLDTPHIIYNISNEKSWENKPGSIPKGYCPSANVPRRKFCGY